ncbi:MAG: hypothetical protein ACOYYS_08200 [Chloroflexota bacterium]
MLLLIFGLVWICVSFLLVPVLIGAFWFQDSYVIARQPLTTTGTVTALKMELIDAAHEPVVYYQFTALQDGVPTIFEDRHWISPGYYDELAVGQQIEIVYAADMPSASAAAAEYVAPSMQSRLLLIGIAIAIVLVGLAMLFAGLSTGLSARLRRKR